MKGHGKFWFEPRSGHQLENCSSSSEWVPDKLGEGKDSERRGIGPRLLHAVPKTRSGTNTLLPNGH